MVKRKSRQKINRTHQMYEVRAVGRQAIFFWYNVQEQKGLNKALETLLTLLPSSRCPCTWCHRRWCRSSWCSWCKLGRSRCGTPGQAPAWGRGSTSSRSRCCTAGRTWCRTWSCSPCGTSCRTSCCTPWSRRSRTWSCSTRRGRRRGPPQSGQAAGSGPQTEII